MNGLIAQAALLLGVFAAVTGVTLAVAGVPLALTLGQIAFAVVLVLILVKARR